MKAIFVMIKCARCSCWEISDNVSGDMPLFMVLAKDAGHE